MKGCSAAWACCCEMPGFKRPKALTQRVRRVLEHVFGVPDDDLLLHHDGNENFWGEAQFNAVKSRLRHADHSHFVIIDVQGFTDDLGITGETCLPKVVIENDDRDDRWEPHRPRE